MAETSAVASATQLCEVAGHTARFPEGVAAAVREHAAITVQADVRRRLARAHTRARARARLVFEWLKAVTMGVLGVLGVLSMFGSVVEKVLLRALDAFEALVTLALSMLGALGMVGLLIWFVQMAPLIGCALLIGLLRCLRSMDTQPEIDEADELVASLPKMNLDLLGSAACPICLDVFDDSRQVSRTLCGGGCEGSQREPHAFHTECLRAWLQRRQTCPLCRQDVAAERTAEQAPLDAFAPPRP